jgi:hypothetical protein
MRRGRRTREITSWWGLGDILLKPSRIGVIFINAVKQPEGKRAILVIETSSNMDEGGSITETSW